ncbi:MAG: rod shape-determining protein MreD, partial [Kamptonema sp. SIO4C4]|nr:rod shape-determining protein MreD [Kamptonema sp. SIO4C4]
MLKFLDAAPRLRQLFNWLIIAGSVLLCLLILPAQLPGTEL